MESGLLAASLTRSVMKACLRNSVCSDTFWFQQGAEPLQQNEFRSRRGMFEEAICHLAGPRSTPRGEPAQQGLKIVHGDSPAKNVLRRQDGERRVSFLERLWPQLRKWR